MIKKNNSTIIYILALKIMVVRNISCNNGKTATTMIVLPLK